MVTSETTVFNSATSSATSRKTYGPWAMKLAAMLNDLQRKDPIFRQTAIFCEQEFPRDGLTNKEGKPLSYYVDVCLCDDVTGLKFALEAMGDGSKSDDIARHNFLIHRGIIPVYIANKDIDHAPHLVLREIRMKLKLLRMICF